MIFLSGTLYLVLLSSIGLSQANLYSRYFALNGTGCGLVSVGGLIKNEEMGTNGDGCAWHPLYCQRTSNRNSFQNVSRNGISNFNYST